MKYKCHTVKKHLENKKFAVISVTSPDRVLILKMKCFNVLIVFLK